MRKRGATKPKGAEPEALEPEQSSEAEAGSDAAATGPRELTELEEVQAERDEAVDSWRRARADYQNLRRRLLTDTDDAVQRAREGMLAELLLVLDYLDMALMTECQTEEGKNLLVGVEMTRGQMLQFLGQQGVTLLPDGGAFDTETHQAIETVESDTHQPGDIVATIRKGYRLGDRMLRHAQVKVASDPDAPNPESDPQPDSDSEA